MAEDAPANAALAGPGLQALLKRAAEDERFRAQLIEGRERVAAEAGIALTPTEAQVLRAVTDAALTQMIDGLAASERAWLQPPAAQPPSGGDPAPMPAGIMPDMPPPPVSYGIRPDLPPEPPRLVSLGIMPDMPPEPPPVVRGIRPDMPPKWKLAERRRKQIGRRRGLIALVLLLAAIGAALWWWLAG